MTATFGEHGTLHHGDCLAVLPTLPAGSVDMVFADLPYGCTANPWDSIVPLNCLWPALVRAGTPDCVFAFTASMRFATTIVASRPKLFRYDLVWDKVKPSRFLRANKMPLSRHENILIFYAGTPCYNPIMRLRDSPTAKGTNTPSANYGNKAWQHAGPGVYTHRFPDTIQTHAKERMYSHPTQKPVALLRWLIATYSRPGDTVLDPTAGVASTACAAIREGRRFVCIERDPGYHAIARERVAAEVSAAQPLAAPAANSFAARAAAWADSRRTARQS